MADSVRLAGVQSQGQAQTPQAADERRDAYLCYCNHVSHQAFADAVLEDISRPFDKVCEATRIGDQCTACLLNAEEHYVRVLAQGGGPRRRRLLQARLPSKRELYRLIDRFAPRFPQYSNLNMPVFAGPGVRTIASVANSIHTGIEHRPATTRASVRVDDAQGRTVHRAQRTLAPGERLDLDVSPFLPEASPTAPLTVGTCWVALTPQERSFNGAIRPHFKVVTAKGVSSLHAQGGGRRESFHVSSRMNLAERQFVALMNPGDQPVEATIAAWDLHDPTQRHEANYALVPGGALLAEVPGPSDVEALSILTTASGPLRYHYVVCDTDFSRLSVDHI